MNKALDQAWNNAVQCYAEHGKIAARDNQERHDIAKRQLSDALNYAVSHLGKPEAQAKKEIAAAFSDPKNLPRAVRQHLQHI